MKKVVLETLKRIIMAVCMVYVFNLVGAGLNIFIPINIITILVVSCLGFSGLLSLVAIFFVLA